MPRKEIGFRAITEHVPGPGNLAYPVILATSILSQK